MSKSRDSVIGIRRARMFVQRDLSWMEGFPVAADSWQAFSLGRPAATHQVDRELLHRSTRAVRTLVRRFPEALPRLVGDVESWARRRLALIEVLKPTVHRHRSLPEEPLAHHPEVGDSLCRLARRARRDTPRLEGLVTALTWLCWNDPSKLRSALGWLREQRSCLEIIDTVPGGGLPLAVRLWQLRHVHGERRVAPCLDWLARPGLFEYPAECLFRFGHQAVAFFDESRKRLPEKPEPRLGAGLIAWVEELAQRDEATRKRGLELLPLLIQPGWQAQWQDWWQQAEAVLRRARNLYPTPALRRPPTRGQKRVRAQLRRLDRLRPPSLAAGQVLRVLRTLPSADSLELYRVIMPGLERWPKEHDGTALCLIFASYWQDLAEQYSPPERAALRRLIRALCGFWRSRRFLPEALEPWAPVWRMTRGKRHFYFHLDRLLVGDLGERGKLKTFFETLSKAREPVSTDESELLADLVAKLPASRVEHAFIRMRDDPQLSEHLPGQLIELAGRLTQSAEDRLLPVLRALIRHHLRESPSVDALRPVAEALDAIDRPGVASRCVEAGHIGLLMAVSQKLRFVSDLGLEAPGPDLRSDAHSSRWAKRYPPELQAALRELGRCDDRAEKIASKLLRKDFPDPRAIRREIEVLRQGEGSDPSKVLRRQNLEARLQAESLVSPGRLANLEKKLRNAAARGLVERWSKALRHAHETALLRYLDVSELPSWSRRDDVRQILLAGLELEPEFRKLSRRLLRRRCGPSPWDLREHPANAAFLGRMSELGIDVGPWIDSGVRWVEDDRGAEIQLALERDPLEILHMGGHFRTCLAPGVFNYFSAVVNACDINKQVLYGRDDRGVVVIRMLLVLTAEGGLLCFHTYCHSSDRGHERLAQDFVRQLAETMGTLVVASGNVPHLLASDWWDDGPTDPASRHPALEEGSELRRALAELPPEKLGAAIREAFAPLACNELTLPLVLQLPELDARPELAATVARFAERLELPTEALVRLGRLLLEAGEVEQGRALAPRLMARGLKYFRQIEHDQVEILELLIELDPGRALRLLRKTRRRWVRGWRHEEDFHRLLFGVRANHRLGRRKQARALLEYARRVAPGKPGKAECDRLLAELS